MITVRSAGLLLALLLSAACASVPPRVTPPPLPASFALDSQASGARRDDPQWYHGFESSELVALLTSAAADNLDLAAAATRMQQAQLRAKGIRSSLWPQVDLNGGAAHFAGRAGDQSARETDGSALLSASYEVDFWGRHRAVAQASAAAAVASAADRGTVLLMTRAAVASNYFLVLALRERQSAAEQDLEAAHDVLKVIEARYAAAAASTTELANQRAAVATASLALPELAGQTAAALGALAVLVGRDPEGFDVQARNLEHIAEPAITSGLPSDLLHRRPDIVAAEATLAAANADLVAARAALFPSIALTASGGLQNPAVQAAVTTLTGTGPTLTLGASLLQTVFDSGRHRALRDEAAARAAELLLAYRSAIRNALLDVETALAARHAIEAQQPARIESLQQSQLALDAARSRYMAGAGDYLTLLNAQRTLHAARDAHVQYRLARLQSLISLSKALGGGWQTSAPSTTE